ncbi:MAG: hypothetical protein ACREQ4_15400 [Candidatus Binataceae bacterium]
MDFAGLELYDCAVRSHGAAARLVIGTIIILATFTSHLPLASAAGQLPLETDDPYSPCYGVLDAAVAYDADLDAGRGRSGWQRSLYMSAPLVELDYGITDRIEGRFINDVPVNTGPTRGGTAAGYGDTWVGAKWRFVDQPSIDDMYRCHPPQSQARWGLQSPVSISIFPQFSLPTTSDSKELGDGAYSMYLPLDIARERGPLTIIGEIAWDWQFHQKSSSNAFELGTAFYYVLNRRWTLLGEQRETLPTAGHGTAQWLFNLGASYGVNNRLTLFSSMGGLIPATKREYQTDYMFMIGFDVLIPVL